MGELTLLKTIASTRKTAKSGWKLHERIISGPWVKNISAATASEFNNDSFTLPWQCKPQTLTFAAHNNVNWTVSPCILTNSMHSNLNILVIQNTLIQVHIWSFSLLLEMFGIMPFYFWYLFVYFFTVAISRFFIVVFSFSCVQPTHDDLFFISCTFAFLFLVTFYSCNQCYDMRFVCFLFVCIYYLLVFYLFLTPHSTL